eukprot:13018961-Alexandrium_andersonii.AAC.1
MCIRDSSMIASPTVASRPGAALPAVGCSAPPCLLAAPRFRVAVVRWWWCVVCVVLRRRSARPRP